MSFRVSASCGHRAHLRRKHHIPRERQNVLSRTRELQRIKGTESGERFGIGRGTDLEQSRLLSGWSNDIAQSNPQSQGKQRLQQMGHSASLFVLKRSEPSLSPHRDLDLDLDGSPLISLSVDVSLAGTESSASPTLLPTSLPSSTGFSTSTSATSDISSASSSTVSTFTLTSSSALSVSSSTDATSGISSASSSTLSTFTLPSVSSTTSTSFSASSTQLLTSSSGSALSVSSSTSATLGTSSATGSTTTAFASPSDSSALTSSTSVPTLTPSASLTTTSTTFASIPATSSFTTTSLFPASKRSSTISSTATSVSSSLSSSLSSSSSLLSSPASSSSAAPSTSPQFQSSFTDTSSAMRPSSRTPTASLLHTSYTYSSIGKSSSTTTTPPNQSLAPTSSAENDFANNKGAIIGLSIGLVVALITSVFAIFLICGRVRSRRALGIADSHANPVVPASRGSRGLSILARGVSGSSSARPMLCRDMSHSTIPWRSPLSDEDGPEEHIEYGGYPSLQGALSPSVAALPGSSPSPVYGGAYAEGGGSSSGHIHGHGTSSNGHEQEQMSDSVDSLGTHGLGPSMQSSKSQMHGFTQAAEIMVMGPGSRSRLSLSPISPVAPSSHGHSSSSHQDHLYRTTTMSSLQPTTNASILGVGSGSSNSHSISGGYSRSTTTTSGLILPRVKINDQSRPSSPKGRTSTSKTKRGGFIERLRGGRGSSQRIAGAETPASSSYYPTLPTRSSLLNPPLPEAHEVPLEAPPRPFLQPPTPLPSPALTEDSRTNYTNGLLSPLGALTGGGGVGMDPEAGNMSSVSLRDHVDYSRPFGGFVYNRMDSSTTVATSDTRVTQTQAARLSVLAPAIDDPDAESEAETGPSVADDVDSRNYTRELDRDHSYFPPQ